MANSENNSEKAQENELNGLPPQLLSRNENRSETSINVENYIPQQSENTGSQKDPGVVKQPESIQSPSNFGLPHLYQHRPNNAKRNELPTDTRPERTQRPEDLKRAQYLSTASEVDPIDTNDNDKIKKTVRKPPSCWVTTSWILTWWAPPFMLRTFGE